MLDWMRLLFSEPPPHTPLTRYIAWNGLVYFLLGATFYAWPGAAQALLGAAPFRAGEAGLVRALGVAVAVIGYLDFFGARTGQDRFGVSTILDRLLIPLLLVPLVLAGQLAPQLGLPFAVLDPALAVGAWVVYARSRRRAAASPAAPIEP